MKLTPDSWQRCGGAGRILRQLGWRDATIIRPLCRPILKDCDADAASSSVRTRSRRRTMQTLSLTLIPKTARSRWKVRPDVASLHSELRHSFHRRDVFSVWRCCVTSASVWRSGCARPSARCRCNRPSTWPGPSRGGLSDGLSCFCTVDNLQDNAIIVKWQFWQILRALQEK